MNSARCWKKIFCHSANATSVESPTNPRQPSSSSGLHNRNPDRGRPTCQMWKYSLFRQNCPRALLFSRCWLCTSFYLVRHFVPKVFSTELWLEESKVVVRLAVKEAYVVYVFVWVLLLKQQSRQKGPLLTKPFTTLENLRNMEAVINLSPPVVCNVKSILTPLSTVCWSFNEIICFFVRYLWSWRRCQLKSCWCWCSLLHAPLFVEAAKR